MICHQLRTIFVHIPKTGGQSIEQLFLERLRIGPADLYMRSNFNPAAGPEELAHLYADEYVRLGHISEEQFNSYFKFTLVRNPYDRLLSEYKFAIAATGITFEDWVLNGWPPEGMSDRRRHIEPQWKFVAGVDKIVKLEEAKQQMPAILMAMFGQLIELPHANASLPIEVRHTPHTVAFVNKFYARDFDLFGYDRREI